jgi:hypothetical protein
MSDEIAAMSMELLSSFSSRERVGLAMRAQASRGWPLADRLSSERRSWAELVDLGLLNMDWREGLLDQRSDDREETESVDGGSEESRVVGGVLEGGVVVIGGRIAWFL